MSLSFKVEKEHLSNGSTVAIAYLSGFIDIRTVKIFESEALNPLLNEGSKYLILNFTDVGYMNSTGLGVLVKVQDKYKDADGDLLLVNVPQKIFDLFKMLGMDTILKVKNTNQEALESLPFPLLPQIPDIPADSSDMLAESGDLLSPPPMNIPSNAGGNIFMAPDTPSPSPIVISSPDSQATEQPTDSGNQNIEFPAPDNFGGFNPFEISGEDARVGEATSIDNGPVASNEESSGITISANDNEFSAITADDQPQDNLQMPDSGLEISDKSPGISDTWEAEMGPGAGIDLSSEAASPSTGVDISNQGMGGIDLSSGAPGGIDISNEGGGIDISGDVPAAGIDLSTDINSPNADLLSGDVEPPGANIDITNAVEALESQAQFPDDDDDDDEDFDEDMAISELDMTAEDDLDDIVDMEDHFRSGAAASSPPPAPAEDGIALGQAEADEAELEEPIADAMPPVGQISDIVTHVDEDDDESSAEMAIDEDEFEEKPDNENAVEMQAEEALEAGEAPQEIEEEVDEVDEKVLKKAKQNTLLDIAGDEEKAADFPEQQVSEAPIPAETFPDATTQMPQVPSSNEKKEMEDIVAAVNEVDTTQDVENAEEESSQAIVAVSGTTEKMEQVEPQPQIEKPKTRVETYYKRKMAVRYYEKMNPLKSFPLLVTFSKEELQRIVMDNVAQQQSASPIKVKKSKPEIVVTPSLKGCVVYPSSMCIDITPEMTTAEFWVTPIIEGEIAGTVEVAYEGKTVEKISLTSSCVKQTWAKISAVGAVAIPMISFLLEGLNWNLPQTAWNLIPKLVQQIESSIGLSNFGVIMSVVSIVAGSIMYSINKPKEAEELEKFFSTN